MEKKCEKEELSLPPSEIGIIVYTSTLDVLKIYTRKGIGKNAFQGVNTRSNRKTIRKDPKLMVQQLFLFAPDSRAGQSEDDTKGSKIVGAAALFVCARLSCCQSRTLCVAWIRTLDCEE
ncbi:hypothetical protein IV203_009612 [Nitzschia inconspicua]|uniref:Uncharacterized protein n=1 Tax=Nitzschia inconspicua TaxID=303405 RepID=A0A9K3KV11_9STRA|nr:hypothetical protein IV203_009612 [Nitzschia inconspicua]